MKWVLCIAVVIYNLRLHSAVGHICDDCRDESTMCAGLQKASLCTKMPGFMTMQCKKTCNMCESSNSEMFGCYDKLTTFCPMLEKMGRCAQQPHMMNKWCRKTCGNCRDLPHDCIDLKDHCQSLDKMGFCSPKSFLHKMMLKDCKRTCGFCCSPRKKTLPGGFPGDKGIMVPMPKLK